MEAVNNFIVCCFLPRVRLGNLEHVKKGWERGRKRRRGAAGSKASGLDGGD